MQVLEVSGLTIKVAQNNLLDNISFTINEGEQWAITGPSGCGKTTLLKALAGKHFFSGQVTLHKKNLSDHRKIVMVDQQHHVKNLSNTDTFYYQQRFNSGDAEDAITVEAELQRTASLQNGPAGEVECLAELLDLKKLLKESLLHLSNGENKRLQVAKALLQQPAFLLLDNPFTGLDVKCRTDLEQILSMVSKKGVHVIMVTTAAHLPFFITNVLSLFGKGSYKARPVMPQQLNTAHKKAMAFSFDAALLEQLMLTNAAPACNFAVRMKNVNIRYDKQILEDITWDVRCGERWSLSGANGSGKSTLLSLVNADNPQAYANDIILFDRQRGTGESIWDIKKKTGFVSPELHLYFYKGASCFEVVASGLFDTIGLFRQITDPQTLLVIKWMRLFNLEPLKRKFLHQLSNSEQRLVLLARALVKNPPLLILDEPCQGLDEGQVELFKELINQICLKGNKTLIFVSHYAHEVPACVTKFIRLENGKRIE